MKAIIAFLGLACIFSANGLFLNGEVDVANCDNRTNPEKPYFQHHSLFENYEACCEGEKYYLSSSSDYLEHFKTCNVEPKNETMILEDSYWTLYDCIIRRLLGSKELNEKNYIELLSQNLSESKRTAIDSLATSLKPTEINMKGNEQLKPIKILWTKYFDAEHQVCTKSATYKSDFVRDTIKRLWAPAHLCFEEKAPMMPIVPLPHTEVQKCVSTLKQKYPLQLNSTDFKNSVDSIMQGPCFFILSGLMTEEDLTSSNLDYETMVKKAIPEVISKSVKQKILETFVNSMRIVYLNESQTETATSMSTSSDIQQIVKRILKFKENIVGNLVDTDNKNEYVQIFTIYDVFVQLFATITSICYRPDLRDLSTLFPPDLE